MRGHSTGIGSVDMVVRAMVEEFPELDPARVRTAVERGIARAANASLDTEGYKVVDLHLARVEATQESTERAQILRELSETLERRKDAERALVVRLSAFAEAASPEDLDPLLRLARLTERWSELPLETMVALVDLNDDASPRRLTEIAAVWQQLGRAYAAADCLERVLLLSPADADAHEALEVFYRSTGEWPVLIDLLGRRAVHVEDQERAELFREIGQIYERELGDDDGAIDAYREADRLEPDHPDALDAIARLAPKVGDSDGEALIALDRLSRVVGDDKARARVLCRAAEIARLHDWDKAQQLFEQARKNDPDLIEAIDGMVALLRDRGELAQAITLLADDAATRAVPATVKSRWLSDAADFCVAIGDTDWGKQLYRDARQADPDNHKAGVALVELCWDTGSLVELAPMLDELCRTTEDPVRLRGYLVQRSKVAGELGDAAAAREALHRAVELDPHDPAARRELAGMWFAERDWERARALLEGLLEHEDELPHDDSVELHYRVAHCAFECGDLEAAGKHAGITLALQPGHPQALLLRTKLGASDPFEQAADELALANVAPVEERAARYTALGDRYLQLGDRDTAREMFREALSYKPTDHLLLTKSLELVADDGDWSYSLDLVQRLIDTEQDRKVRARYRKLAAEITRDELDDPEEAGALLYEAIEDDPLSFDAADQLEQLLGADHEALVRFYYRRLEHVRHDEGRPGERLRLWDRLGELCLRLARREDAVAAFEVGLSLDPDNLDRREQLADLYIDADPAHDADAIAQHQAVLRVSKQRVASYEALRTLYRRTEQHEKARACDEALAIIGVHVVEDRIDALFGRALSVDQAVTAHALGNDDWLALSRLDVDLQLSALFALVAPAFAVERARIRPPQGLPPREHDVPTAIARVLLQVVTAFGIARPPVYHDRDQLAACRVSLRARDGVLVPVLVLGRPALDNQLTDHELAFLLARQLADLRGDRIARLLCPRAGELAQIIELASAQNADATSHASRWLTSSLHPVELDQALAIGARLRERGANPLRSALDWIAATERAADRIGFVVAGDLANCVRVLERDATTTEGDRVAELVWASVTEELLAVRGRYEGWSAASARPPQPDRGALEQRT